jgi:hypothetical protein
MLYTVFEPTKTANPAASTLSKTMLWNLPFYSIWQVSRSNLTSVQSRWKGLKALFSGFFASK